MTELSNVLKTYQDNALKTLQGPASIFFSTSHHYHKALKRELDSPPPPSSDEDYKHASPSPMQCNISIPSGTVIESRQISSPSTPPSSHNQQQQQQQQREYCQSPPPSVTFIPMMQPIQSQPILTSPDSECGELIQCHLEGQPIGCFSMGGELRLCFPQILNTILPEFPLDRIHRTIEDLHISCLQSTPEQLAEFKRAKILPPNVPPCGLITRTNAERLVSELLHKPVKKKELNHNYFQFRVYHRCFGKCEGICTPEYFSFRDRECIECIECHGMLTPNKFVLHVCKNKPKENFTCHWGFESNKWRSYIHVAMSEANQDKCNRLLDQLCGLEIDYERVMYEMEESSLNLKRKAAQEDDVTAATPKQEPYDIPLKKTKMDENSQFSHYLRELYSPAQLLFQFSQLSRQQSWLSSATAASPKHIISPFGQNITSIPYLPSSQEPPILQNPERVVRHTENERFDRSYQPNVALAPRQTILTKERDEQTTVIKREIQIKQERPSTPNNESPELRHTSPETTSIHENGVTGAAPISPEGQSGSNEITSSTSPVPVTNNIHHHHQIPNKRESVSPPQQSSPTTRSHTTTTTLIKTSPSVVVKLAHTQQPLINGKIKAIPLNGNPEFELSTDTDDESLGEPDSSNHLPQSLYEFVAALLKTNSSDDHMKILDIIKYMEKEITQLKEAHKREIRERQQVEESLRKENERLQHQLRNNSSVIANASCLSSSSSSSSSSLSSSSSFDYERNERRNSIVEKPNVIIKPPKKSILRITPHLLDDCIKPTATTNNNNNNNNNNSTSNNQPSSIVIMPKSEDIINNNNTKLYNNNSTTTTVINGNQTEGSSDDKQQQHLQKTAIKTEKL